MEIAEDNIKKYLKDLPKSNFDDEISILNLCDLIKKFNIQSKLSQKYAFQELFELISIRLKYNKQFAIKVIQYHPEFFRFISNDLKDDKDVILECIKNNGSPETAYSYNISADLYDDHINDMLNYKIRPLLTNKQFLLECIKYQPYYIRYAQKKDLENFDFIKNCLLHYPKIITFLPYELQINEELLNIVLSQEEKVNFYFITEDYPFREKVIKHIIYKDIDNLFNINMSKKEIDFYLQNKIEHHEIIADLIYFAEKKENETKEFIKKINNLDEELDDYVIEDYSKNYNVMKHLLSVRSLDYFHFVSENLRHNINFIIDCINISNISDLSIVYDFPPSILLNKKIIFTLIKKGYSLNELLEQQFTRQDIIDYSKIQKLDLLSLKNDLLVDIDLLVFSFNKEDNICDILKIYEKLSSSIKKEKRVNIEVLKKMDRQICFENNDFIINLNLDLKNDEDIAKQIILINPYYLAYLSKDIRNNKKIVNQACKIDKDAIKQATIKRQFLNIFGL